MKRKLIRQKRGWDVVPGGFEWTVVMRPNRSPQRGLGLLPPQIFVLNSKTSNFEFKIFISEGFPCLFVAFLLDIYLFIRPISHLKNSNFPFFSLNVKFELFLRSI